MTAEALGIDIVAIRARLDAQTMPLPWSGCHVWLGALTRAGYGVIHAGGRKGKTLLVHRIAYELDKGPIAPGMTIDHRCRVRSCRNPEHLEQVTNRENIIRGTGWAGRNARRTHCANGHEFAPENTINIQGGRRCRSCANARKMAAYVRDREANGIQPRSSTHCRNGHELTTENSYVRPTGERRCRQCVRDGGARYRARRHADGQ